MATKEIIVFAASLVAASSAALAAANADDRVSIPYTTKDGSGSVSQSSSGKNEASGSGSRKLVEDKFAPRLDGLRFIETLTYNLKAAAFPF